MDRNLLLAMTLSFGLITVYLYVFFPNNSDLYKNDKKSENTQTNNHNREIDRKNRSIFSFLSQEKDLKSLLAQNPNIHIIPTEKFQVKKKKLGE